MLSRDRSLPCRGFSAGRAIRPMCEATFAYARFGAARLTHAILRRKKHNKTNERAIAQTDPRTTWRRCCATTTPTRRLAATPCTARWGTTSSSAAASTMRAASASRTLSARGSESLKHGYGRDGGLRRSAGVARERPTVRSGVVQKFAPTWALNVRILARIGATDRLGTLSTGFLAKPRVASAKFRLDPSPARPLPSDVPSDRRSGRPHAPRRPPAPRRPSPGAHSR